jgi:hypothetical protein
MDKLEAANMLFDAAMTLMGLLNQVWGFYVTVIVAILGGIILSPALRPPQPLGRVLLILVGLAAFFAMHLAAVVSNSYRIDFLLQSARKNMEGIALAAYPQTVAPPQLQELLSNPFVFYGEPSFAVHLVIDVAVLVAVGWVLLSDGERRTTA